MYSSAIIEANISKVVDAERVRRNDPKFRIIRFDPPEIDDMVAHLDKVVDKHTVKEDGSFEWSRELTIVEQRFIDNEMILCQLDWKHWAESYCYIQLRSLSDRPEGWDLLEDHDDKSGKSGPLGKLVLNGMQEALLQKMAALEEVAQDQARRKVPVNGILLILLKARQLGASTVWQSFIRHRVNFYSYFPALIASIDAQSTQSLQRRSERMWEHMPVWMRSKIKRKTIDGGSEFVTDSLIQWRRSVRTTTSTRACSTPYRTTGAPCSGWSPPRRGNQGTGTSSVPMSCLAPRRVAPGDLIIILPLST